MAVDQKGTPSRPTGTMTNRNTQEIVVGGIVLVVDKQGKVLHLVDQLGKTIDVPENSHYNGNKGTVDLPGGDHLTFKNGTITRNTPIHKVRPLDATQYYRNEYTGPEQKVDAAGTVTTLPVKKDPVAGPVLPGRAPGSAPMGDGSTIPAAPRKAAPAKAPSQAPAKAPVVPQNPPATGGRTSVPTGGAPPSTPITAGTVPGASASPTRAAAPLSAAAVNQRVAELFGAGMAIYLKDKELGPILRQAATEGWSQLRLQGAIQQTSWWHNTADPARKWDVLNNLDHATAKTQVDQQSQTILDAARADGLSLNPLQIHDLAVNALKYGWTAGQVREHIYDRVSSAGLATAEQTKYGYLAGLADNPEVKALLEQGAREGWDQNRLQVALQNTNFWKQTTDAQRRWQALNAQDPGSAKSSVTEQTTSVLNTAQALGVTLDPTRASQIATDSLQFGWSAEQISKAVGAEYHYQAGAPAGGTAGKSIGDLKSLAAQYMVPLSDATLGQWTQSIVRGSADETAFTNYLKEQAKVMRPWAAKQIDAGLTTQQLVDPYKQMIASTLEIAPDQVDFTLPKFSTVLDGGGDPKTGQFGPMSLSAAQQYLRSLPDYGKTSAANDQAAQFAQTLTHVFGRVA